MGDNDITEEDLHALDELEQRAWAEIERRSAAMLEAQRFSPLGRRGGVR